MNDLGRRSTISSSVSELSSNKLHLDSWSARDLVLLFLLAALWGAAFILVRLTVPETGALFTASMRIIIAALALTAYTHAKKIPLEFVKNIKPYLLCGVFGAAFPFFLFAYAAPFLPAATAAFFNATSPLFCLVFSTLFFSESITLRKLIGLGVGLVGVLILVGFESVLRVKSTSLAILASVVAPASFAISAITIKHFTHRWLHCPIDPLALATGSMIVAALILLPEFIFSLPAQMPSRSTLLFILLMGLLPSAFAQIIFVPLVVRMGAVCAMSVSFLIPLFSIVWAYLFLGEGIHSSMVAGGLLVLTATALILQR